MRVHSKLAKSKTSSLFACDLTCFLHDSMVIPMKLVDKTCNSNALLGLLSRQLERFYMGKDRTPRPQHLAICAFPLRGTLSGCEFWTVCWKRLIVERPAQATRTHNPTPILACYDSEGKQRARKPSLKGSWGVIPKP